MNVLAKTVKLTKRSMNFPQLILEVPHRSATNRSHSANKPAAGSKDNKHRNDKHSRRPFDPSITRLQLHDVSKWIITWNAMARVLLRGRHPGCQGGTVANCCCSRCKHCNSSQYCVCGDLPFRQQCQCKRRQILSCSLHRT